ncbi:MAG: phage tail tape measure protein, partial [Flavobacterium sp.]
MTNDNNGRLSFEATIDDKDFKKKVNNMGDEVVGLGKRVGANSVLLDKSIAQLTSHLGELKDKLANTRGVAGIRQINIEIEKTQKEITRLSNIGKKGFDDLGNALPKVSNEAKKAGEEFDKLGKKIKDQPQDVGMLTKAFGGLGSMFKSIAASFGLFAGIQGVVSTIRGAVSDVVAFDKSMTNLSAIAGVSRSSLKGLESDIRKVASESINTATAVADMSMELIKLGTTPDGVRQLLKPVNDLSIAFQSSADATAVLLKGTLNAFQASESEAQRYADVMAMSANKTALGFQEIADSFSYISATANVAGYSIEETAAFMG